MRYICTSIVASLLVANPTLADTIHNIPADFPTIQAAIDSALVADGDTIAVAAGTYTGSGNSVIDPGGKAITIQSTDGPEVTILDGEGTRRVLQCTSGEEANTVIEGFTITGGWSSSYGGGIYCFSSNPTLSGCTISNNTTNSYGGGIACDTGSSPTLTACTISDNVAISGGGIDLYASSNPTLTACVISGNTSSNTGGGINCEYSDPTLINCTISGNTVNGPTCYGGGTYCSFSNPTLSGCTISNNTANYCGGGISCDASILTISDCTISNNTGNEAGGGLFINGLHGPSAANLNDCIVSNNTGGTGGGIWAGWGNMPSSITIKGGELSGNTAETQGGGMKLMAPAWCNVSNCTISDNTCNGIGAWATGGGVDLGPDTPTSHFQTCTFSGNSGEEGGALSRWRGDVVLDNCTFHSNDALYDGGALFVYENASASLTNCTLRYNSAINDLDDDGTDDDGYFGTGGAICGWYDSEIILDNCELYENEAQYGGAVLVYDGSVCFVTETEAYDNSAGKWEWPGYLSWAGSSFSFEGACTADDIGAVYTGSATVLEAGSHVAISGDLAFFSQPDSAANVQAVVDIDAPEGDPFVTAQGYLYLDGSLVINNSNGSLQTARVGNTYPIFTGSHTFGSFASVVSPIMGEGLALEFYDEGQSNWVTEVVATEVANIGDVTIDTATLLPIKLVAADVVGGDGEDELLALYNGTPGSVGGWDMFSDPNGVIDIPSLTTTTGNEPVDMDGGDLDSDGLEDLLVANAGDASLTVLRSAMQDDGTTLFVSSTMNGIVEAGETLTCVAVIDWNGDDWLDAVVGIEPVEGSTVAAYQIVLDVASGAPTMGPRLDTPMYTISAGEGGGDTHNFPQTPLSVIGLYGEPGFIGSTLYGLVHKVVPDVAGMTAIGDLQGSEGTHVTIGDLDGDGQIDVVCSSMEAESLFLFNGNASESDGFDDSVPIGVAAAVGGACIVNIDGDHDRDLIISIHEDSENPIRVLRNDSSSAGVRARVGAQSIWSQYGFSNPNRISRGSGSPPVFGGRGKNSNCLHCPPGGDDGNSAGGGWNGGVPGRAGGEDYWIQSVQIRPCAGDANGNGSINIQDLLVVLGNYNGSGAGDLDGNGVVNIEDMLLVIGNWGSSC